MSDISIVTITYNNFDELVSTLQSTQGLDCENVVVNGGSCPRTKALLQTRTDIISISEPDKGISDAFNKGVKLSTKKAIWFLNSGDICIANGFSKFAGDNIPENDFVYSPIIFKDEVRGLQTLMPHPNRNLGLGSRFLHPGLIVAKSIFDEIGDFDLSFKIAMDYEFICRMSKGNYKGAFFNEASVLMDGTGVSSQRPFRAHFELAKALLKNDEFYGRTLVSYVIRTLKILIRIVVSKLGLQKVYAFVKKYIPHSWRE